MPEGPPATWSIRELKAELNARGVAHTDCTEKRELVERLAQAPAAAASRPPASAAARKAEPPQKPEAPTDPLVRRVLSVSPGAFYSLLDVKPDADDNALKKAYRILALKLHPDKCTSPGADEAFKRVSAAFATLSDPQERAYHDRRGGDSAAAASAAAGGVAAGASSFAAAHRRHPRAANGAFGDRDAEELFRAFFGDGDPFGAGTAAGGASPFPSGGGVNVTALATRGVSLVQRLGKAFVNNPWTLVTLLSGVASLVSIAESLVEILGRGLVIAVPAAAVGLYACPPQQRRYLAMLAAVLLCSPFLL